MKPQQEILQLLKRTSHLLRTGTIGSEPAWYKAVLENPPTTDFIPKLTLEDLAKFKKSKDIKKPLKTRDLFKPKRVIFPENHIRTIFYTQHPWELARPKIVIEEDALDFTRHDWSKMDQQLRQLDGESVVQRTMWLMKHNNMTEEKAYEKALAEFYALRVKEEVEIQTTEEEARMFGAVFHPKQIEVGIELERQKLKIFRDHMIEGAENARMKQV
ncbi:mitochondrial 37S ribosomal protein mS23 [Limtongia smithiae]|uniref:mitochondrial 37S ribosomal protein mS23 n=1 Tax=Limtongia smithiae TaxID=1125753 RepID=UPI0034CE4972